MELAKKLMQVVEETCPGSKVRPYIASDNSVSATIVWDGFAGMADRVRLQMVLGRLLLNGSLEREDLQRVTLFLVVTPEEDELLNDDL